MITGIILGILFGTLIVFILKVILVAAGVTLAGIAGAITLASVVTCKIIKQIFKLLSWSAGKVKTMIIGHTANRIEVGI